MVILELYRKNTAIPDLYGKILFDGKKIIVEGTSSVFKKFFEAGIIFDRETVLSPADGESYLEGLKKYLSNQGLTVRCNQGVLV